MTTTTPLSREVVDTSRHFENPFTGNIERLSQEECLQKATILYKKCLEKNDPHAPPGSLYHGALGARVFVPWRLASLHRKLGNLQESDRLLRDAFQYAVQAVLAAKKSSRVTLIESPWVGARVLQIAIWHDMGQDTLAHNRAQDLIGMQLEMCQGLPPMECDVLYGRAGVLQTILFLRRALGDATLGKNVALQLASEIINEGKEYAERHKQLRLPLLWKWHGKKYLGAAHGIVGILHTLLCLEPDELSALDHHYHNLHDAIKGTIKGLDQFCWSSGNLDSSISSSHTVDGPVHWCHGAPGHILLLMKAYEVYHDSAYHMLASKLAKHVVWKRGLLKKGLGLCHGIPGNAYALLAAGRCDNALSDMAYAFARFAWENLDQLEHIPDEPYSLYVGIAGFCVLLVDLAGGGRDGRPRFPLYDHAPLEPFLE